MKATLVIVPCGQKKIWDKVPTAGPTDAKDAYIGPPFRINRTYAEAFGDAWIILSAKYGFIDPTFTIPGTYNVTFKRKRTAPISTDELRAQVGEQKLGAFTTVIGLGGKEYRQAIEAAFAGTVTELCFPFSGLPIGKAMQAIKRAIATDVPLWIEKAKPSARNSPGPRASGSS